jgi:hypothetical protein
MRVKTLLILDQNLPERARQVTGIQELTALLTAGLKALIARCFETPGGAWWQRS